MKLEAAIKEYLIEIEIRKYTPKTIRGYKSNLYLFLHFIQKDTPEIDDLTLADVRRFTKYMVDRGNKGTYINGILKTLKSFIQYCYEEGYGGFNTKKSFKWCKEEKPVILAYKPKDVRSMLKECGGSGYYDIRDRTIITMFIETGIRNSELCNIKPEDIHNDFILINGKNHKQRVVPVTPILKKAMVKYDREKEKYFAIRQVENYYFLSRTGRRLTPEANENILKKRGSEICGVRVSPHTCRHFYTAKSLPVFDWSADDFNFNVSVSVLSPTDLNNPTTKQYVDNQLGGLRNTVNTLTEKFASIIDIVYPVGSIYMSVNAADPSKLFSGTSWEKLEGRFLLGSSSTYKPGSTGGEATHTLTANEMPEHAHYMASGNGGSDDTWTPDAGLYLVDSVTQAKNTFWAQLGMNNAGGSAAHNNMPPYLVVNMWKRIN